MWILFSCACNVFHKLNSDSISNSLSNQYWKGNECSYGNLVIHCRNNFMYSVECFGAGLQVQQRKTLIRHELNN